MPRMVRLTSEKAEEMGTVTLADVKDDHQVKVYLNRADRYLDAIGYTEHGERHADLVAGVAGDLLHILGKEPRLAELARIAGYLHDIGNVINRDSHAQTGAVIAGSILTRLGMETEEVAEVMTAVGNHHEENGDPVSEIGAALILADKSDVHRSRVRNPALVKLDIHDRVNYAAVNSSLNVDKGQRSISMEVTIDTSVAPVMEYFEIFLSRMIISRRAAKYLSCEFEFLINGTKMI